MQFDDAERLRKLGKACDHPSFEEEFVRNSNTEDLVCTQCGRYKDETQGFDMVAWCEGKDEIKTYPNFMDELKKQ
jgi:hypothetical protein